MSSESDTEFLRRGQEAPQETPERAAKESAASGIEAESAAEREVRLEQLKQQVVAEVQEKMRERFEGEPFHNPEHPIEVERASKQFLSIVADHDPGAIPPQVDLIRRSAAEAHDIVVNYTENTTPGQFNSGQRMRHRGFESADIPANVREQADTGNERASFDEFMEIALKHDPNQEVYTAEVLRGVRDAIKATYPEAGFAKLPAEAVKITDTKTGELIDLTTYLGKDPKDPEGTPMALNFTQKYLTPESSLSTLAIAVGDLGAVGRVEYPEFKKSGFGEFRELNELIAREVADISQITPERRAQIAQSILGWAQSQIGFALWQKLNFQKNIEGNVALGKVKDAEAAKADIYKTYGHFDENILGAKAAVDAMRAKYAGKPLDDTLFTELLEEAGYDLQG